MGGFFFLEHAGELCIIVLKRKIMGGWASVCCWKCFWCVSLYLLLNI